MENLQERSKLIRNLRKIILNVYWNQEEVECIIDINSGIHFSNELFSKKTETKFNLHFIKFYNGEIELVGLYPDSLNRKNILILDKFYKEENFDILTKFLTQYKPKNISFCTLVPATFKSI